VRRRVWTRRAVACLFVAALLGLTAACALFPSGIGPGGRVFQVWALQDPQNQPIIQAALDSFNKTSTTKGSLTVYLNDAYKQKLQVSMGSPNAPDIFFNWGGANLAPYVKAGRVATLDDALSENPSVNNAFLDSVMKTARIGGHQYGLPINGIQPVILYYNKAVFAKYHQQPPRTWDELMTLVDAFKTHGVIPLVLPGTQAWTELMYLEYLLDRVGGPGKFEAIAGGNTSAWHDPAMLRALQLCQDLAKRGGFGTNFASINYDNTGASALFAEGKAAMFLMGSWEYTNQAQRQPDFFKSGNLGFTTFPTLTDGAGNPKDIVGNPSNYFSVRAGGRNTQAATTFLIKTLKSDAYVTSLVSSGQVPAIKGVNAKFAGSPNANFLNFTYDMANKAPAFTQSWDQALSPSVATELLTNLQKLFLSDITPQQFVDAMEKAQ
jgi:xylobiose transport system substrate-binding protein